LIGRTDVSDFRSHVLALQRNASTVEMARVIDFIRKGSIAVDDLALLASVLGRSANTVRFPESVDTADIASTGGPTSLSTLLGPLYLRTAGCHVPKLGVPGRPAGGIDVMAQVPRFKITLTAKAFERCVRTTGFAHFLAGNSFAPLDAKFFAYRKTMGAQAVPDLAIASILAKKLAVGVKYVGLDVRVAPHGNFGTTWRAARANARRFCRVAAALGIKAVCYLTEGIFPFQPYLGRSEVLWALQQLFDSSSCPALNAHANMCFALARATMGSRCQHKPTWSSLRTSFEAHLVGQGSEYDAFLRAADRARASPRFDIPMKSEGLLTVDLAALRSAITDLQHEFHSTKSFPDPCGLVFRVMPGSYVWQGDIVASVRIPEGQWRKTQRRFSLAFKTAERVAPVRAFEEVRYA